MRRSHPQARRLALGLSGLAAVAGLVVFNQAAWIPALSEIAPRSVAPLETAAPLEIAAVPSIESLRDTRVRPLFLADRRAPAPEAVAGAPPQRPERLDYDLIGVTLFEGRGTALVRDRKAGRVLRLAEGQRLGQWRVTGIAPDRLRVRWSGIDDELRLKDAAERRPAKTARKTALKQETADQEVEPAATEAAVK